MVPVALAMGLAFAIGYGAQRGGLCLVTGIEQLLDRRSARLLLASSRTSIWSIVVTVAIFWLVPSAHFSATYAIASATLFGGILFGAGAAINGGCAFGTLTRLGAGDFSFALTLVGIAIGIGAGHWILPDDPGRQLGPTLLASPSPIGIAVLLVSVLFCAREALTRWTCPDAGHWPPEYSAILIGTTGGALYALTGNWSFTLLLQRASVPESTAALSLPISFLISSAALAGAIAAAVSSREFRPRIASSSLPRRLVGGTIMGFGGTLIPGGNGVLLLEAIPALSPHAVPAYLAVLAGAAAAIMAMRTLTGPRIA
ncbi:YeeE/YedE thiosulfate transporter family protein [Sphingomonas sp. CARO-RG-8B-R24-01]|uniref:YeeE/YedE thiosulfate transporter family protein n=1 Tax=Sphingomonas sp. CARO-RG-8B-R24-01 TaxID=2914831 RepID=UPI001F59276C|nr:YeeE/YedE thiosulfate transporter family protein [Sphingomonas sp. CARO-RG-8B-R24-01]